MSLILELTAINTVTCVSNVRELKCHIQAEVEEFWNMLMFGSWQLMFMMLYNGIMCPA